MRMTNKKIHSRIHFHYLIFVNKNLPNFFVINFHIAQHLFG